jgi:FkbM family methyltransferase
MPTKRLINVALNRPASQSSLSVWSKPDDPLRAVSGFRTGNFAFCTAVEAEPYWSVDLQSAFLVRRIAIFNREDCASDRACPLIIETSMTGEEWREISTVRYVFGGARTGAPLDLHLIEPVQARYLRLRRTGEPQHFHLDQVEIYTGVDDVESCAQLGQDLWVLQMTGGRSGGTFVEIGSTDGVSINNTFLLEARFSWRGVCVEPNPTFYEHLKRNRTAKTFQRAVFRDSDNRHQFVPHGELGTLVGFENSDFHAANRESFMSTAQTIAVETISPNDLFEQSGLPSLIDFLSLDTEGSEWDILESIDFSRYGFALMAIEHNFVTGKREMIYNKLKKLGYYRFDAAFDDWFYHPVYLNAANGGVKVDFDAVLSDYRIKYGYGKDQI